MNADLLRRVSDGIVAHPKSLEMREFFRFAPRPRDLTDLTTPSPDAVLNELNSECGTTACIAGWALVLSGADLNDGQYQERAAQLLDITHEQAQRLFHAGYWPTPFRGEWYQTPMKDKRSEADIVRRRIAHFIEHDGDESFENDVREIGAFA